MTNGAKVLEDALVVVRQALKERGFKAKGTTFHMKVDSGNIVMLSLQKRRGSSQEAAAVTINFGVYSARVGTSLEEAPSASRDVWSAHWRERISENGREKWLHMTATDSADDLARSLLSEIEHVLPDLLAHSTDEALRDAWMSQSSPGITSLQRLMFLTILVNQIGPRERLADVVEELRTSVAGTTHEGLVEAHFRRVGVRPC